MYTSEYAQAEFGEELNAFEAEQFDLNPEFQSETNMESPFNEVEEMELASELLEITNEAEMDQFIGKLIKKAWRGIRKVAGGVLRPLGGVLKAIGKKALPFVAGALGSVIPGVGTALGGTLGALVSQALETEFENLEAEEKEFEMARRFVRLAGTAAQQVAQTPPTTDPQAAVRAAITAAMRQHVPGAAGGMPTRRPARTGRWIRRGRQIVVLGLY